MAGTTTSTTSLTKREIVYFETAVEADRIFDSFFDMVSPQILLRV
jgi:hypothetical protein